MDKKIEKISLDSENKIEEVKQDFQKLIEENVQKDEKINFLEEEIQKTNDLCNKKIEDLTIKFDKIYCKCVNFVGIKNKWSEIDSFWTCCKNKCINTNNPVDSCIKGNGLVKLINGNIKYIVGRKLDRDTDHIYVYAENPYNKPQYCFNYSLYYFEIKCIFEEEIIKDQKWMCFGLKNCITSKQIDYFANGALIFTEEDEDCLHYNIFWNNNDIYGCGLVYPPTNKLNEGESPYVFFTQNGIQISEGILLKQNSESYKPFIGLRLCSIEGNFGDDLESKPFKYDVHKHLILKEFY
uniref:Uncharacterized protein n=1 Tax=Meloidogyne enterolobii TaxID=390850 RepID=A0A6V7UAZ7_MELEN|nr:unnamed protein product [Meloidogyne enterolobii]